MKSAVFSGMASWPMQSGWKHSKAPGFLQNNRKSYVQGFRPGAVSARKERHATKPKNMWGLDTGQRVQQHSSVCVWKTGVGRGEELPTGDLESSSNTSYEVLDFGLPTLLLGHFSLLKIWGKIPPCWALLKIRCTCICIKACHRAFTVRLELLLKLWLLH